MFTNHRLRIQLNERVQNLHAYHHIKLGSKKVRIRLFLQEQLNHQTCTEQESKERALTCQVRLAQKYHSNNTKEEGGEIWAWSMSKTS